MWIKLISIWKASWKIGERQLGNRLLAGSWLLYISLQLLMKVLVLVYVALVFVLDYKKKSKSKVDQDAVSHPGLSLHQLDGNPRTPDPWAQTWESILGPVLSLYIELHSFNVRRGAGIHSRGGIWCRGLISWSISCGRCLSAPHKPKETEPVWRKTE